MRNSTVFPLCTYTYTGQGQGALCAHNLLVGTTNTNTGCVCVCAGGAEQSRAVLSTCVCLYLIEERNVIWRRVYVSTFCQIKGKGVCGGSSQIDAGFDGGFLLSVVHGLLSLTASSSSQKCPSHWIGTIPCGCYYQLGPCFVQQ